ncbi:MAG TPA: histone deacetylase family protein [Desulfobacteraceae bacterium]|nr:histone deacetylase family protein [Desulfobacteraceae bacterium]HPJ68437.1 histone deacetylase family protein [Desulfobacteraceae bacterium]HPQ28709.1 histone deacetylase family protein [Desulfobacteraceae bacterium]
MKIIFHERYYNSSYAMDPAAAEWRLEGIMALIKSKPEQYEIITPYPAGEDDILRAHGRDQYELIRRNALLYELAALAAGGAIRAAETAYDGDPAFAVIRPPGHHASADSCWGFCYFNNMSISLLKLFSDKKIKKAFILDFDLHTGDGNINILQNRRDGFKVQILNPGSPDRKSYLQEVEEYMKDIKDVDIFAASAGFDQGISDWGSLLYPEDYTELGRLMKVYSEKICKGRRYAVLEGGYNHEAIGVNTDSFCKGFE